MANKHVAGAAHGLYIKQVARMVGVSPSVIRGWERQRLIAPTRSPAGYRVFTMGDVERLRRVRDLATVEGLNAAAIRRELGDRATHRDVPGEVLGGRLRALRLERGLSLRQLARATGLSASFISALERSLSTPSIASLQKLAAALGTNIVKLLSADVAQAARLVVRENEQSALPLDIPGVRIFELAAVETQLEPLLFRIAPGAGSREPYSHAGDEFLYVLRGTLQITLDEMSVNRLGPGDSMTFASQRPHTWRNDGDAETELIWVNTPATF
jgi:transcriptional regulator with XRE-family HTH domain